MKFVMKTLCVLLALAGGAFLSCFASVFATKLAGGLQIDAWGMGAAYCFLFGGACGFVVAIAVIIVANRKDARFLTLFWSVLALPCAVVFTLFLSVTFLSETLPRICYEKKLNALTENLDRDPRFVDQLVAKARAGTLGKVEKSVLKAEVFSATRVQSNDVPFLVEYYMDDVHVARSVLNNKKLINGDLYRRIYDGYKCRNQEAFPIVREMASSVETPDDILLDIAEHNSRYPGGVRYDKKITDRAKETLLKKKVQPIPQASCPAQLKNSDMM